MPADDCWRLAALAGPASTPGLARTSPSRSEWTSRNRAPAGLLPACRGIDMAAPSPAARGGQRRCPSTPTGSTSWRSFSALSRSRNLGRPHERSQSRHRRDGSDRPDHRAQPARPQPRRSSRRSSTTSPQLGLKRPITVSRGMLRTAASYDLVCGQGRLEAYQALGQQRDPCHRRRCWHGRTAWS